MAKLLMLLLIGAALITGCKETYTQPVVIPPKDSGNFYLSSQKYQTSILKIDGCSYIVLEKIIEGYAPQFLTMVHKGDCGNYSGHRYK